MSAGFNTLIYIEREWKVNSVLNIYVFYLKEDG